MRPLLGLCTLNINVSVRFGNRCLRNKRPSSNLQYRVLRPPALPRSMLLVMQSTCCRAKVGVYFAAFETSGRAKMGVYFAALETPFRPFANIDLGGAGARGVLWSIGPMGVYFADTGNGSAETCIADTGNGSAETCIAARSAQRTKSSTRGHALAVVERPRQRKRALVARCALRTETSGANVHVQRDARSIQESATRGHTFTVVERPDLRKCALAERNVQHTQTLWLRLTACRQFLASGYQKAGHLLGKTLLLSVMRLEPLLCRAELDA